MANLDKLIQKIKSKDKKENFPVGSIFLKKDLRRTVWAYYNFARCADDVADNKVLSKDDKLEILNAMEAILKEESNAKQPSCASLLSEIMHARKLQRLTAYELLTAFKWDSIGKEYFDWEDLLTYCRYSASPVGRFMLDLHGETYLLYNYSDSLCSALQILNHIQDIKEDYLNLDRIYIPKSFMIEFNVNIEDLKAKKSTKGLQKAINKMLYNIERMLLESRLILKLIKDKRLKTEILLIFILAQRLLKKLKKADPIKNKVKLSKLDWILAIFKTIIIRPFI